MRSVRCFISKSFCCRSLGVPSSPHTIGKRIAASGQITISNGCSVFQLAGLNFLVVGAGSKYF